MPAYVLTFSFYVESAAPNVLQQSFFSVFLLEEAMQAMRGCKFPRPRHHAPMTYVSQSALLVLSAAMLAKTGNAFVSAENFS